MTYTSMILALAVLCQVAADKPAEQILLHASIRIAVLGSLIGILFLVRRGLEHWQAKQELAEKRNEQESDTVQSV